MKNKNINNMLVCGNKAALVALGALLLMSCGNPKNKKDNPRQNAPEQQEDTRNNYIAGVVGDKTIGESVLGGLLATMVIGSFIKEQRKSKQR